MNRVVVSVFTLTLIFGSLLVLLYPVEISEEKIVETTKKNITTTTINKPVDDYTKRIEKLVEQSNFTLFSEIIAKGNQNFLKDLDQQLEYIRQENIETFAYTRFNKFKKDNGQLEGIYWNGYLFNNAPNRSSIIEILSTTSVNTLVIDVKTDNGHILFDAEVDEIALLNNERIKFSAEDLLELRKIKDIYLIGRIVVYQDPLFAQTFPDEAVFDSRKNTPYSQNGQYFLDPSSKKVQNYIQSIAVQACELGFDEIQYDYIRYPDSSSGFMVFDDESTQENRVNNINTFLKESKRQLHAKKCLLSADTFGYILTNQQDGGIGQNLETIVESVDFISPMVYPSHYSDGSFGYQNPNKFPYEVITAALTDALERGVKSKQLRPFLQGFWHSTLDIQNNIKAASDLNMDWLIWNILSVYELEIFTKLS
tara:strand:+ start:1716 stop:2987 length:1272 start_codon:yes stop_codon:yes gene_type:complete